MKSPPMWISPAGHATGRKPSTAWSCAWRCWRWSWARWNRRGTPRCKPIFADRDLIGDLDFTKEEVETVLDVAFDLKRKRALGEPHAYLRDKVLAMLFFFSSTRTRGSFEAGMAQLGGHAAFIESKTTQISHGDTPKEIGEIFGRYFDGIAIRHVDWGIGNGYLNAVAKASRVPVLNMQCDIYHPFQCLADLMTIIEKKGRDLRRKKMVVSWAYAASYQKPMSRAAVAGAADAALWHGRGPGAPAGVQADARDHGAGPGAGAQVWRRL